MLSQNIIKPFDRLRSYCEKENFKGWDPFDGMNSRFFQALPIKKIWFCRLVMIQLFKRNPINLRKLFLVPKGYNAKGIALFIQGYAYLYELIEKHSEYEENFGTKRKLLSKINSLSELLISLKTDGYSGSCWGYNFDWQSRNIFFFPKGTPTVVVTTFCATALMEAYEVTKNKKYLDVALSAADFVKDDLNRTDYGDGFFFSYSPQNVNGTVINASLLGSKLLSYCYKYTRKEEYKDLAKKSILASISAQNKDGSWVYGLLPTQSWIDSFHTGYNLEAIYSYQIITGDHSFASNIEKGFDYYVDNFFLEDGTPKYYHNKIYNIDIHCPAQFIITLLKMNKYDDNKELAEKVIKWTIDNMESSKGYFYYQLKKSMSSKIPYMRWSNAFMFNMFALYLKETLK